MKVKIKKLNANAVIPTYSKKGDAGLDLTAISQTIDENGNYVYGTGLAFEIPKGYVGLLFPRSSNSKTDLRLTNSVGILDSGYRGEVLFKYRHDAYSSMGLRLRNDFHNGNLALCNSHEIGDRIGQLIIIPYPEIEFEEVDNLSETERGDKGYGSTGK